jgi:hypothetical protein
MLRAANIHHAARDASNWGVPFLAAISPRCCSIATVTNTRCVNFRGTHAAVFALLIVLMVRRGILE